MTHSYFIYYRVDTAHVTVAERRIQHLLHRVKNGTGVAGRLMKKRGEPNLWMEVYENIAETAKFEPELADAVSQLNAGEFLQPGTGRHVECFEG